MVVFYPSIHSTALEAWQHAREMLTRSGPRDDNARKWEEETRAKYEELHGRMRQSVTGTVLQKLVDAHQRASDLSEQQEEALSDWYDAKHALEDKKKALDKVKKAYDKRRAELNDLMRQADEHARPWRG
jgi:hypothetical protein